MDDRRRSHLASALPPIALGFALSIWVAAPAGGAPFEGRGRVTAVDPGRNTVRIAHDAIPDLLPVRESEFPVEPSVGIGDLHPGDRIRFTLGTADESHGLLTVSSVAREDASMEWSQGLLLAAATSRLAATRLYQVSPMDPATVACAIAVVVAVALTAAWLPARRAARIEPLVALRRD